MTESSSPDHSLPPSEKPRRSFLGTLARGVLLISGCGLAFLGGTTLASRYPGLISSTPLVEQAIRLIYPAPEAAKIVLPSDSLFHDNQSLLRSKAYVLLDSIVPELRNQRGATILIAAHTDDLGEVQELSQLSFQQARTVRQYLNEQVGKDGYRWVIVGKGNSAPLAENTNNANRQRNRRVEITIDR